MPLTYNHTQQYVDYGQSPLLQVTLIVCGGFMQGYLSSYLPKGEFPDTATLSSYQNSRLLYPNSEKLLGCDILSTDARDIS